MLCNVRCLGTTEKVFESKKNLYDAYIDIRNIQSTSVDIEPLIQITSGDKMKFEAVSQLRLESIKFTEHF